MTTTKRFDLELMVANIILVPLSVGVLGVLGYLGIQKRDRPSTFIIGGTLVFVFSAMLSWLASLGLDAFDETIFEKNPLLFMQIGCVIEILSFSTGLAYQSKQWQKERIEALEVSQKLSEEKLLAEAEKRQILLDNQEMRSDINRKLHDGMKNDLATAANFLIVALNSPVPEQSDRAVRKAKDVLNDALENIYDYMWIINPRRDTFQALMDRLHSFVGTTSEASGKPIQLSRRFTSEAPQTELDVQSKENLFFLVKEAVSNAIRHAYKDLPEREEPRLQVVFEHSQRGIFIQITDNGMGFNPENVPGSCNGVENMRQRAKKIHGDIDIKSQIKGGTSIIFTKKIP